MAALSELKHKLHMKARAYRYWLRTYIVMAKIHIRMMHEQKQKPHNCPHDVIISLASYKPRFHTLHLTLECLLRQSVGPYRVILWVHEDDIPYLPARVLAMKTRGLEVRATQKNFRSYNKLVHTLREFPDAVVLTTDDDTYYQHDFLETFLKNWSGNTKEIVCGMAFTITSYDNGEKKPFLQWIPIKGESFPRYDILPFGIGGVLYPPGALHADVLDDSKYMELSPRGDDLWFFWMARRNGVVYRKVDGLQWPVEWIGSQVVGLKHTNNEYGNDEQIKRLAEFYGWPDTEAA
jgi:hypothetical protein